MTSRGTRTVRLALIAGVGLLAVACAGGSSSSFSLPDGATWTKESGKDVTVDTRDNVFVPQFIEVKKGAEVTWDNTGRNRHNVLPDEEGDFKEVQVDELDPGMKASRTFDEVGEFGYYCSLHGTATKGMFGAIKVVE